MANYVCGAALFIGSITIFESEHNIGYKVYCYMHIIKAPHVIIHHKLVYISFQISASETHVRMLVCV